MRVSASVAASVLLAALCACAVSVSPSYARSPAVLASYRWVDYAFADNATADAWVTDRGYENVVITGVQVWTPSVAVPGALPRTFVSTPRWKTGVPATLSQIDFTTPGRGGGYKLQPYPSWAMNAEGSPAALQSVLGFAIDSFNRMSERAATRGAHTRQRSTSTGTPSCLLFCFSFVCVDPALCFFCLGGS